MTDPEDNAAEDLARAREAATAMYVEGDPMGFVRPYREALDEDKANGGDMRRVGLVAGLTLYLSSAMHEIDRLGGDALTWLKESALRDQE